METIINEYKTKNKLNFDNSNSDLNDINYTNILEDNVRSLSSSNLSSYYFFSSSYEEDENSIEKDVLNVSDSYTDSDDENDKYNKNNNLHYLNLKKSTVKLNHNKQKLNDKKSCHKKRLKIII